MEEIGTAPVKGQKERNDRSNVYMYMYTSKKTLAGIDAQFIVHEHYVHVYVHVYTCHYSVPCLVGVGLFF